MSLDLPKDLHAFPAGTYTRLKAAPSPMLIEQQYAPFWPAMKPLFPEAVRLGQAWVVMLTEQRILHPRDAGAILSRLAELEAVGAEGFPFDPRRGDLYFNIEAAVVERTGPDAGGRLYTGRSRIDTEPTVWRLFLRQQLLNLVEALVTLADTVLDLADRHTETVMPGYTGTQPAQPWTFGHYLLSFADAFARDFERISAAFGRVNMSLLGSSAGAGSDLPLDRQRVADLLGFDGFIENSREFCTAADAQAETTAVCSILLGHFGQLAQDLHTWCTQEFGLMELADEFSGASSFMPQKKNPMPLHKIRSMASGSVAYFPAVLSVMRTSSQDFDLNTEALTGSVAAAVRQALAAATYFTPVLASLEVHQDRMRSLAETNWATASEIPTLILRERGIAWRTAHRIAERLVSIALERALDPTELTGELLDQAAVDIVGTPLGLPTEALRAAVDPLRFLRSRQTPGSPNPQETTRMLGERRVSWDQRRGWYQARLSHIASAREGLRSAAASIVATADAP